MADALFDTTVFIDYYEGDPSARELVDAVLDGRTAAAYSPISTLEVWLGLTNHEDEMAMTFILGSMKEVPLTDAAAITAATWLRGMSPRRAETMFRDALIAATARERGEVVVTRNVKDFQRFDVDVKAY
jgi:predicted nucleic acid-binding protein